MGSRDEILGRIRKNTKEIFDMPDLAPLEQSALRYADPLEAFSSSLAAAGGKAVKAYGAGEKVEDPVSGIVKESYPDARKIVSPLDWLSCRTASDADFSAPEEMDGTDVAVVEGEFGVAENGAVWIVRTGKFRVLPFICEALVIVLDHRNIVDNMHEAYLRMGETPLSGAEGSGFGTFISGPSKTADIEQALVFGAHGARSVTVVLI